MFSTIDSSTGDTPSLSTLERLLGTFQVTPDTWIEEAQQTPLQEHLAYWQRHIEDAPLLLHLPADHAYSAVRTFRSVSQTIDLPATPSLVLFAAFLILLCRLSGQEDFLVGIPSASRARTASGELIGRVPNTVVVHADLSGNPTVSAFLARIRDLCLEALAHQDMPFASLLEHLAELSQASHVTQRSLFQAMFTMQESAGEMESGATACDVLLKVRERAYGVQVQLVCTADLFDVATVRRMIGHFQTLLAAVIAHPQERLMQLPLLTEAERHQLLVEWNQTAAEYPAHMCLHHCFEAQAEQTPDVVALVSEDQQITYQELNRRADQLACDLRDLGCGPETLVGLCAQRSIEVVIGMWGILKAGGAFVPLDPAYPPERLAFMLEDTHTPIVLTQQHLIDRLPSHAARVVFLEDYTTANDAKASDTVHEYSAGSVEPMNLAYVIYTSGSTGRPKGVAITHQGVLNNLLDMNRTFGIGTQDRMLAISSLSFDMSVYELLGTLVSGGTVIMPVAALDRDPQQWTRLLVEQQVTVWNTAPSLLEMLMDHVSSLPSLPLCSLRVAFLAGDWIPLTLPDRLRAWATGVQVVSLGGATEVSVYSTTYVIGDRDPQWKSIPYGKPQANQSTYVLDALLQPVPIGVRGELYFGGVGLARGYFNRPDVTAEKFVPNPFSQKPGDRLYKTGDLTRYLPDGNLQLLGRMDYQVKVRGVRIELGEIEAALSSHPGVREVVVLARKEGGDTRLVAYLVPAEEHSFTAGDLRRYLQGRLPDPMVPSAFVSLKALPRSPNGKLDRQALPAPDQEHWAQEQAYAAPRTSTEALVAEIWSEIFALPAGARIGIQDNFFVLGGHSLLASKMISRLRTRLHVEVPLRLIFEAPTIAELSEQLDLEKQDHHQRTVQSPTLLRHEEEEVDDVLKALLDQIEQLSDSEAQMTLASQLSLDRMKEKRGE